MKKYLFVATLALFLIGARFSQAQTQVTTLKFADSSSSGTYKSMLAEIKDVCTSDTLDIQEAPQNGGAPENLDALVNNQVAAAFMHADVIYAAAGMDPAMKNLKTLVALYPEEVHVLALRNSLARTKGYLGTSAGSQSITFNTLADLAGRNVGAAGGGVVTARIFVGQGGATFNVQPYNSGKEVIDALNTGAVDAAIFVGGSPLPNLIGLKAEQYKLIPVGDSITSRLPPIYKPATINYVNLKSGAIKTVAPQALIVTRRYTTPKMILPQAQFRACVLNNLDELKETPGKHPKWQLVEPKDHGVWEWLDLPDVTTLIKPAVQTPRR